MYVFGIGVLVSFIVQVVTGTMLATKYVPSAVHAYDTLQFLTDDIPFGRLVRGMHFYGASAMVLLVAIHMARVFLTGSYKFPREFNWVTGVALFLLTMLMAYTGQLLRWDENGVWTVVVGAYFAERVPLIGGWLAQFILGGSTVGGLTLSRFFGFHVFLIPGLIVALVGLHLYLVLHHGISDAPRAGDPVDPKTYRQKYQELLRTRGRPYWPDAIWKEIVFGVVVVVVITLLALIFGARPLGRPPDPTNITLTPIPDWFLVWYYALITINPPALEEFVLVYLPILVVVFLFTLPFVANRGERSPRKRPWAIIGVVSIALFLLVLIEVGTRAPWVPDYQTQPLTATEIGVATGPVFEGSQLFYSKGCQYCHIVAGRGGRYGPDLTGLLKRISPEEASVRIVQGIGNMPPYVGNITVEELDAIMAFLHALSLPGRPAGR
jgi:ubiquinol-cytochrome c reductase cytochrome b subunit